MGMAGHGPSPLTSSHGAHMAPHLFPHTEGPRSVIPLECQHQAPLPSACNTQPVSSLPFFLLLPSPVSFGNSLEPGEALSGQDVLQDQILPTLGPPISAPQPCQEKSVGEILGSTVARARGAAQTFPQLS